MLILNIGIICLCLDKVTLNWSPKNLLFVYKETVSLDSDNCTAEAFQSSVVYVFVLLFSFFCS